ncbi:T6SS immunity protein Tdi1 domain-containing protein [Oceanirhabdus sp. W0125-5]|uniref:T6SS immunity protein Tdi1 domain-containing protein n=1 Tax=Oceanirhabdus sp. W0125-5 TaxID=2999116 RepID=UPI0022F30FCA|nr:T6SS immunity protein Tdi1 domain-containing protein [Oceanirhabdus sp. W0125-5]WBW97140.1 DUF1851 domain-containing protein [Oceanirhabdus sp. W0125-5]
MLNNIFNDFILEEKVPESIINKYDRVIPDKLLEIWKTYGFGSILNGYLKIVNPDDFDETLKAVYVRSKDAITLFTTSMGDILVWEDNKYLILLNFRKGKIKAVSSGFRFFFSDLEEDKEFYEEVLDWLPYPEAIEMNGKPAYDECFGYTPLLGLGGLEKVENLKKMKLKEHIGMITQFMGQIE